MRILADYWPYFDALPYAALAVAAAWLWARTRSLGSALLTVGFVLVLPERVARLADRWQFAVRPRGSSEGAYFLFHHHSALAQLAVVGLCVAAVGLLAHASRARVQ